MAATSTFYPENFKGFKKTVGVTPVTDISLPVKENQQNYSSSKYRGSQSGLSIVFYGDKGHRIIVKHGDAYKLKFRTVSAHKEGYETLLLHSSDLTSLYDNNLTSHHVLYTLRQYVRIGYEFAKLMIIQRVTKETLVNNDKSSADIVENIGINIPFKVFNDTLDQVDSIGSLESIAYSTQSIPNDVEK